MPTNRESITYYHNGWIFKTYSPVQNKGGEVYLLLHGFTGDENSMDVFVRSLPIYGWIVAPRAPFPGKEKGYSWATRHPDLIDSKEEILETLEKLWIQFQSWKEILGIHGQPVVNPIGFSQGGAMALLLTLLKPFELGKTACLSGFLPDWAEELIQSQSLMGKEFLITHGSQDEIIPVARAREISSILCKYGAVVNSCEAPTGHKLSLECFKKLEQFFSTD